MIKEKARKAWNKMERTRQRKTTKSLQHRMVKPMIILILLLIAGGIFWFSFDIRTINVSGSTYYSEEEIKELVIDSGILNNSFLLSLKFKFLKQKEIPFIENLELEVINNHTINLTVNEKIMTGCVKYMNEYIYFDKDGIVLEITKEKKEKIPIITGVTFERMVIYDKLAIENEDVFETILNLSKLIKKYDLPIDKVIFGINNEINLVSGKIEILLGKKEVYDEQIAELSGILPKSKGLEGKLDMTDFKVGQDKIILK